ncbi:hypothetical protein HMPREF3214_01468 [Alloscardovia omnicolens]|nr:hypothetical protein HMPREF3214_01468 [Alloscardovia omnicolens]
MADIFIRAVEQNKQNLLCQTMFGTHQVLRVVTLTHAGLTD